MDRDLLQMINDTVGDKPKHRLILGGDICWNTKSFQCIEKIACKNVILVGGNHDTTKNHYKAYRDAGWRIVGCYQMKDVIVTHIPVHTSQVEAGSGYEEARFEYNIHGHTHELFVMKEISMTSNHRYLTRDSRYLNMSCEAIEFTPKTYEQLVDYYKIA